MDNRKTAVKNISMDRLWHYNVPGGLPSHSIWPRIQCGCCLGMRAPSTPRLCSSARFFRLAARWSEMVLQRGRKRRQERGRRDMSLRIPVSFNINVFTFLFFPVLHILDCAGKGQGRNTANSLTRQILPVIYSIYSTSYCIIRCEVRELKQCGWWA